MSDWKDYWQHIESGEKPQNKDQRSLSDFWNSIDHLFQKRSQKATKMVQERFCARPYVVIEVDGIELEIPG